MKFELILLLHKQLNASSVTIILKINCTLLYRGFVNLLQFLSVNTHVSITVFLL